MEVIALNAMTTTSARARCPGGGLVGERARLGLTGVVEAGALRAVLEGSDPSSGERLTGWRKIKGFDLTLSAPKSVSLLWGLGDEHLAAEVVRRMTRRSPRRFGIWRTRRAWSAEDGAAPPTCRVVAVSAAFRHRTSREADPNLHRTW
ncbi:MAG: relaxase domain-containing protein [Acidimicrobiales bacterium]